jgi:ATP-binding cassette subfamily B protein
MPHDLRRSEADTRTTAQMADGITNNVNVKLFASYEYENKRFQDVTESQHRLRKKSWDIGNFFDLIQSSSMIGLEFWLMYVAIKLWNQGVLTVGDIVLIQTYLLRLFDKLWDMGQNIRMIYGALADANEMTEMLATPYEVQDVSGAKKLKVPKGKIEFKNVSFGYYRETPILQDFNLEVGAGERLALIGPSGGGKSTIVKTMFRFHDIQSGQILIDGQDISKVTQDSLRANMSLVPQEPILFHRSLMDNIRYARPKASEKEVIRAAKMAHADEFISSFREGYDTLVGERGIKLSGGERQRVAIARAILKDAPILVLDEATSSLDSESEMYIQDALSKLMKGRTTIVVAHRLSTIMQMDRIVVISDGKVVEQGRHDELLKVKKGMYQKLWGIQAGGFASLKTKAV